MKKSKQRGKISLNSYLPTVRHTAIFKMDNQEPTVEHVELFSMLCGSLDGKEVWRRMDTGRCMAKSLHCSPETMTILLISYTPKKKKKVQKKKKKTEKEFLQKEPSCLQSPSQRFHQLNKMTHHGRGHQHLTHTQEN